ncbi:MAG: SRPBCC family protein [Rhodoferax sp.]
MTTLVFVVAFCIVAVLVYMARYSGRVQVSQTRLIDAPLATVYAQVADFSPWNAWCPWLEHAPEARLALSASTATAGSHCAWSGARAGQGQVLHLQLQDGVSVRQRVRLQQPFRVRAKAEWRFAERDGKTELTWSLRGRVAFSMRAFAATVNAALAFDLRYGLDRLAAQLEPAAAPRYRVQYLGMRDMPPLRCVYRSYNGPIRALALALQGAFVELRQQLAALGVEPSGAPLAFYLKTHIKQRTTLCHMALPVAADADVGALALREVAAHRAFVVRHQGGYGTLELAWYHAMQALTLQGVRPDQRMAPYERYLVGAQTAQENDYLTELHIPILVT